MQKQKACASIQYLCHSRNIKINLIETNNDKLVLLTYFTVLEKYLQQKLRLNLTTLTTGDYIRHIILYRHLCKKLC